MKTSRVPTLRSTSKKDIAGWFSSMGSSGLLFHPDDDPGSIVHVETGKNLFTAGEIRSLRSVLRRMFKAQGERVYDLGLPAFHKALGIASQR